MLEQVQQVRQRPLFLIDLSVPRNVDPACALVEDVYVYDMDTMEEMTAETRRLRSREIAGCELMIREWVAETGDLLLRKQAVSHQKCAEK